MTSREDDIKDKHFLIKIYANLQEINRAIKTITQNSNANFQLSILGKLASNSSLQENRLNEMVKEIRIQLSKSLGRHIQLGHFKNPEVGSLFIAGHLTDTFLYKVDKKKLASLTVGLLGIFKGLGIKLNDIDRYQKELQNGNFLLIIRGNVESLTTVESLL